jgi:hypothetical protein
MVNARRRGGQTFTVYRSSGGKFAIGGWTEGTPKKIVMIGTITPLNAKDEQHTPEGERIIGSIAIYTKEPLHVTRNPGGTSDEVEYNGTRYTIHSVKDYSMFGATGHFKALGMRKTGD